MPGQLEDCLEPTTDFRCVSIVARRGSMQENDLFLGDFHGIETPRKRDRLQS
jgi:hypothetical protein